MNFFKKVFSLILATLILITGLSLTAFAEDVAETDLVATVDVDEPNEDENDNPEEKPKSYLSSLKSFAKEGLNYMKDGLSELTDVFANVKLLLLPVWGLFYLVYAPFAFPEGISNFFIGATEFVFSPILAVVYVIQNLT